MLRIHPKVKASTLGGAISVVIRWALHPFIHVTLPYDVQLALTAVCVFVCGFFCPD